MKQDTWQDSDLLCIMKFRTKQGLDVDVHIDQPAMFFMLSNDSFQLKRLDGDEDASFEVRNDNGQYFIRPCGNYKITLCGETLSQLKKIDAGESEMKAGDLIVTFCVKTLKEIEPPRYDDLGDSGKTQFMAVQHVEEIMAKGRLVGVSGSVKGRVFDLFKDKMTVGRDSSNDICLESDGLSRAHAVIEFKDKELHVMDFNSTNGTYVAGKKVTQSVVMPGNIIQFANGGLRFEIADGKGGFTGMDTKSKKMGVVLIAGFVIVILIGGGLYLKTFSEKKALEKKKKELEALATGAASPDASLKVAEEAFNSGHADKALEIVSQVLAENPGFPKALLLQGKFQKEKQILEWKHLFDNGKKLYQANDFNQASEFLSKISPEYEYFDEASLILKQISELTFVEKAFEKAMKDFNAGNIEEAVSGLKWIQGKIPVHIPTQSLLSQIEKVQSNLEQQKMLEESGAVGELETVYKQMMSVTGKEQNYYYKAAERKLSEVQTGRFFKLESLYFKANQELAKGNLGQAFVLLENAVKINANDIKTKIVYGEVKARRQKLIQGLYQLATTTKDPAEAKMYWRKIVDLGEADNNHFAESLAKLGS